MLPFLNFLLFVCLPDGGTDGGVMHTKSKYMISALNQQPQWNIQKSGVATLQSLAAKELTLCLKTKFLQLVFHFSFP